MKLTCTHILNLLFAAIVVLGVIGCGSSPNTASTSTTTPPPLTGAKATSIYTVQNTFTGANQILQFTAGANGSTAPTATLNPPAGMTINSVAIDSTGQIYVSGYLPSNLFGIIQVYAAGATGTPTPLRTIRVPNFYPPTSMAIDAAGSLYTVNPNDGSLFVYSSTANGSATPTRTITGSLTQLNLSEAVAVDSSGNIYVTSAIVNGNSATGAVYVFSSTANGNVAPIRTITNSTGAFLGGTLDSAGNLYVTVDTISGALTGSVVEYAPGASGAATPIRTIAGSSTQLVTAGGINVDGAGNIYVANQISSGTTTTYAVTNSPPQLPGTPPPSPYSPRPAGISPPVSSPSGSSPICEDLTIRLLKGTGFNGCGKALF